MAYETLKKRISRCGITEHQPLTLAYLITRAELEEQGEYVARDPRITDELLAPLMDKIDKKGARRLGDGKNSGKILGVKNAST